MDIFVDLAGASGVSYRFRGWPEVGHSAMAGNFAVVERRGAGFAVLMIGVTSDLAKAQLHAVAAGLGEMPLYVRLNVSRTARHLEHDDLVAYYRPAHVFVAGAQARVPKC